MSPISRKKTIDAPRVLAIIPARGGSKGIPRKNIKPLCGKPLLLWVLEEALKAKRVTDVVVSSDDEEILEVARKRGGEKIILKRPKELAEDTTPDVPVLRHAISQMEKQKRKPYDFVMMLHATTPFLQASDIDSCVELLLETRADSVVSVYKVTDSHPIKMKRLEGNRLLPYIEALSEDSTVPRQSLPPVYRRNAGIYVSKRDVIIDKGRVWGNDVRAHVMPELRSVDINIPLDFEVAEIVARKLKEESDSK